MTTDSLTLRASRQFVSWLKEHSVSILTTTYQKNHLLLVGLTPAGDLSLYRRIFPCSSAIAAVDTQTLYLATLYQVWRFENTLMEGQTYQDYDRLYIPRAGYTTGEIDIEDMSLDQQGRLIIASSLLNSIGTISQTHSFKLLWRPDFITDGAVDNKCFLTGVACRAGQPRYVTLGSQTNTAMGWQENFEHSGVVIDIQDHRIQAQGLCLPRSPRWYQNRLWLLNAGRGEFGYLEGDQFKPVAFCSGYPHSVAFYGDFAIVSVAKPPKAGVFERLPLHQILRKKQSEARCALLVIDLRSGDVVHSLTVEGDQVTCLWGVAVLPQVTYPMALGFQTEEIRRYITFKDQLGAPVL